MHFSEVPSGVTHQQTFLMAIAVGHFEPVSLDNYGAIAQALCPPLGGGEGEPQRCAVRTGSLHIRAGQEARQGSLTGFRVDGSVVVILGPSLSGFVQGLQSQIRDVLEHGQQLTFHARP